VSLLEQAALDHRAIVEDATAFGRPCIVTNPAGSSLAMVGQYREIHLALDPQTGQQVSVQQAGVVLSLRSLLAANLGVPNGISDPNKTPWIVQVTDLQGITRKFKVSDANPDELGSVACDLEAYKQ